MAVPAPEPGEQVLTFRAYAEEWLAQLVKPHPQTIRKYRERLEKHVFPRLGNRPIAETTGERCASGSRAYTPPRGPGERAGVGFSVSCTRLLPMSAPHRVPPAVRHLT
ncbi:phage integrase central domain-containing protein [Micromonospora musae]|uniref:phage integrase central domain-containing protein n=1 Tax=Micromonospora musae TaxID=1894970 RepID=UPI0033C5AD02